mgnify:CR=1 FL=1
MHSFLETFHAPIWAPLKKSCCYFLSCLCLPIEAIVFAHYICPCITLFLGVAFCSCLFSYIHNSTMHRELSPLYVNIHCATSSSMFLSNEHDRPITKNNIKLDKGTRRGKKERDNNVKTKRTMHARIWQTLMLK